MRQVFHEEGEMLLGPNRHKLRVSRGSEMQK